MPAFVAVCVLITVVFLKESDTEVSSECSSSGRASSLSQSSTVVKKDKEFEKRIREANLFDCSVVIHQAAIGQDYHT